MARGKIAVLALRVSLRRVEGEERVSEVMAQGFGECAGRRGAVGRGAGIRKGVDELAVRRMMHGNRSATGVLGFEPILGNEFRVQRLWHVSVAGASA